MSTRFISIDDINSVLAAVEDKEGLELLKKIKENTKTEKDLPERKKGSSPASEEDQAKEQEARAYLGQAKEEDIGVSEKSEGDSKRGLLKLLEDKGLVIKGGYINKEGKRTNSYKITNEGLALLYLVERIKGVISKSSSNNNNNNTKGQQQQQQQVVATTTTAERKR